MRSCMGPEVTLVICTQVPAAWFRLVLKSGTFSDQSVHSGPQSRPRSRVGRGRGRAQSLSLRDVPSAQDSSTQVLHESAGRE